MRTTVGSSRRVGVWAARKRAIAVSTRAVSSEPSGHASAWRTAASYTWYQWNPASSARRAWPRAAISAAAVAAALEVAVGDRPGAVDLALGVPARRQLVERAGGGGGQPGGGHVEEPVEVDAEGAVDHAAGASSGVGMRTSAWCSPLAVVKA